MKIQKRRRAWMIFWQQCVDESDCGEVSRMEKEESACDGKMKANTCDGSCHPFGE